MSFNLLIANFFNVSDSIYQGVVTSFGHLINFISFNGQFATSSAIIGWDNTNSSFNIFVRNGARFAIEVLNSGLTDFNFTGPFTFNYDTMNLTGTTYISASDTAIMNAATSLTITETNDGHIILMNSAGLSILPGGAASTPGFVLKLNGDGTTCNWAPDTLLARVEVLEGLLLEKKMK